MKSLKQGGLGAMGCFSRVVLVKYYTGVSVLLLGAVALALPSGYSFGPALLFLGSASLFFQSGKPRILQSDWLVVVSLVGFFLVVGGGALLDGQGLRGLDKPARFLLAVPVIILIMTFPPRLEWLWHGLSLGGVASGGLALWQKVIEEAHRAGGFTQIIQFGNISLLQGMLCLAGLGWAWHRPHRYWWCAWLLLGAMGGVLGSLLSGSRGGWLAMPGILTIFYLAYGRKAPIRIKVAILGVLAMLVVIIYSSSELRVSQRVDSAVKNIEAYFSEEDRNTSVGLRLQMWSLGTELIRDKPWLGWGESGLHDELETRVANGEIDPSLIRFRHMHNEFIDIGVKHGVLGVAALLALYLVPLALFYRGIRSSHGTKRSLAVAGTLLPTAYIGFGLTQGFLEHNSGAMVYAFWLATLWGLYRMAPSSMSRDRAV